MLDGGVRMHPIANWFWPTVMSLALTYESHEASCNKRGDTYLGRRSASLMKEFWTLCILAMTVSEKTFACQSADINKKRQIKKLHWRLYTGYEDK